MKDYVVIDEDQNLIVHHGGSDDLRELETVALQYHMRHGKAVALARILRRVTPQMVEGHRREMADETQRRIDAEAERLAEFDRQQRAHAEAVATLAAEAMDKMRGDNAKQ